MFFAIATPFEDSGRAILSDAAEPDRSRASMFWLILSFGVCFAVMCIVGVGVVRNLPQSRRAAIVHLFGALLFLGGLLNFLIFWHVSVAIGGDASSGTVANGKYFVSSHGRLTEVSPATWRYSYVHKISIWVTHPLAGVGWLLMYLTDSERKKHSNRPLQPTPPHDSLPSA
jgi:hypothetical protein